ncbi:BatD family protein [Roseibium aggregatum]|uniref:BatD family protein n=1 Tax=Roseibium aggregatum TaxID=187304 RepID=A0A939EGT5_9HYPH|nr:BatD family protein [Roseibium aggregatum]MBN9671485.1 BatD family protein [Roseibium aggregatum]
MVIRLAFLLLVLTGAARAESLRLVVPDGIRPVVGEMIAVTIRGEYTRRITLETLIFPDSEAYDWVQLARDSWKEERVKGRAVLVFQRRIALFPRQAGSLEIGPVTHELTVVAGNGGRETLEVHAEPLTLQVAPFPGKSAPLSARSLTVEDELSASPGELRDGETLIRKVTIHADGTLPHLLPPRPEIREPWLISFTGPEVREIQLSVDGPRASVAWEWHLRPKTGEPGVLPPIEIPWFDTGTRTLRTAEIPAIPFGYASFEANRAGSERLPALYLTAAFCVVGGGLLIGLGYILTGTSLSRKEGVLRLLRRWSPFDPTRHALAAAARQDDLPALRSAVERYLSRRRTLGLVEVEDATEDLDRAIFARPETRSSFNAKRYVKGLLKRKGRLRGRSSTGL